MMSPDQQNLYSMIDLHGTSAEDAERIVNYWLSVSGSRGVKHARFVTGRGNHINSQGERATLYKNFLGWIEKSLYKDRVERCDQHDGYFEITFKDTKKQNFLTQFFKAATQQYINSEINDIKTRAEKGEAEYQMLYAQLLEKGEGVQQNFKEAVKFFKLAANNKKPEAMHEMARCYFHGIGVRQSDEEAVKWLQQADKLGFAESAVSLGDSYWLGNGVKEDNKIAVSYYAKAAAKGNSGAMRKLANAYKQGTGVIKSMENSYKWYQKAADLGDVIAQYNVGIMYQSGIGVKANDKESWRYLLKAAEGGDPDAQHVIGNYYLTGKVVQMDEQKAMVWFKKAAANGSAKSLHQLSLIGDQESREFYLKKSAEAGNFKDKMLLNKFLSKEEQKKFLEDEIKKHINLPISDMIMLDYDIKFLVIDWMLLSGKPNHKKKALYALEVMAEENCILSLRRLAMIYVEGYPSMQIKKDLGKTINYLQKGAELHDDKAIGQLAGYYGQGRGVPKSLETAFKLNKQAADRQNPTACYNVAVYYFYGTGVKQDLEKSREYVVKAIGFERQLAIREFLSSGFMDEYLAITEEALALHKDLVAIADSKDNNINEEKSAPYSM